MTLSIFHEFIGHLCIFFKEISFAHFLNWGVFVFLFLLLLSYRSTLYILDIKFLLEI